MTVRYITFGCKVNQYETQAMRRLMERAGYPSAPEGDTTAAVTVINSCTVTGESDRKLRQLIRKCRREAPDGIVVLTGCFPQAFPDTAGNLCADIILGNARRAELPAAVDAYIRHLNDGGDRELRVLITPHDTVYEPLEIDTFTGRTRAFVKIEDGCNRFCSYCIIPYARGRVRSRLPEDLTPELTRLAGAGYREIVLVGINLSAYGQDTGHTLADAVERAAAVDGICRVRLGSLEPDLMSDAMLDRLAAVPTLCPQFHIALQSGCDATLRRMNRHYTVAQYADLCRRLRERFPGCALTTDILVGFPGETEEEFAETLRFAEETAFARVHVFAYSRRPGTVADRLPDQVDEAVKADRSRRMIAVTRRTAAAYAAAYVGRTVPVLLETRRADGLTVGHTDTYLTVCVATDRAAGELVPTVIESAQEDILYGREAAR